MWQGTEECPRRLASALGELHGPYIYTYTNIQLYIHTCRHTYIGHATARMDHYPSSLPPFHPSMQGPGTYLTNVYLTYQPHIAFEFQETIHIGLGLQRRPQQKSVERRRRWWWSGRRLVALGHARVGLARSPGSGAVAMALITSKECSIFCTSVSFEYQDHTFGHTINAKMTWECLIVSELYSEIALY